MTIYVKQRNKDPQLFKNVVKTYRYTSIDDILFRLRLATDRAKYTVLFSNSGQSATIYIEEDDA